LQSGSGGKHTPSQPQPQGFTQRDCLAACLSHLDAVRGLLAAYATDADPSEGHSAIPACCALLDALDGHRDAIAAILVGGGP
jgi:hypothetical protein